MSKNSKVFIALLKYIFIKSKMLITMFYKSVLEKWGELWKIE